MTVRTRKRASIAAILAGGLFATIVNAGDASNRALGGCPGYTEHLRNARAYLEHADRPNAVAELKRAREAIHSCEEAQAGETVLARRAACFSASSG